MCKSRNKITWSDRLKAIFGEQRGGPQDRDQGFAIASQIREYHSPQEPELIAIICIVSTDVRREGQNIGWYCPVTNTSTEYIVQTFKLIYAVMIEDSFAPITSIWTKEQPQFMSQDFKDFCQEIQVDHVIAEFADLATPQLWQ